MRKRRFSAGSLAVTLVAALPAAMLLATSGPAHATQPGDAARFETWTGYDVGRRIEAVATGDFNGDGAPDAAWARDDFFTGDVPGNSLAVTLNLGEGTLSEAVQYPAQDNSTDIGAADLDGDADLDLVVTAEGASLANGLVDLYFNDGSGGFTRATTEGGEGPTRLEIADLNGDGAPDIAMGHFWTFPQGFVSVLLNNGDGTFGEETRYPSGFRVHGVASADVDGDLDRDLISARSDDETNDLTLRLFLNDGTGSFTRAQDEIAIDSGMGFPTVETGDLDGDGAEDFVVAGFGTDQAYLLLNRDGLDFEVQSISGGFSAGGIEVADYDGDQDDDIITATLGSSSTGDVSVFLNQGGGEFVSRRVESSHQPYDVDTADFDLDGLLDMAVPNRGSGTAAVHPQRPNGSFAEPPTFPTFSPPSNVTVADFDGDGDTDVATSQPSPFGSDDAVQTMVNDGTGQLAPGALIDPGAPEPESIYSANLNGDGAPDLVWVSDFPPFPFEYALNNGDGTFAPPVTEQLDGCSTGQVTTADADNDGDQDLLIAIDSTSFEDVCIELGDSVAVVPNNGDGTFGAQFYVEMEYFPYMAAGADFNGDQLTDIVSVGTGQGDERDVSLALGTGGGAFAEAQHFTVGDTHFELSLADLENDGDVDVATVDRDDMISVLLNDGTGDLSNATRYDGEEISGLGNQIAIDVGDLNSDGAQDLVVANFSGSDIGVHFGRGDGSFDPRQVRYGMHSQLRDIELTDMDGDGQLDVVGPLFVEGAGASAASAGAGASGASSGAQRLAPAGTPTGTGIDVLINRGVAEVECTIIGTHRADRLVGTRRPDVICAGGGDDLIAGGGGDDLIIAGAGGDRVRGGDGNDQILGGDGNDFLDGNAGQDSLVGGKGDDRLVGGDGVDSLVLRDRVRGNDLGSGDAGDDVCVADRRDRVRSC